MFMRKKTPIISSLNSALIDLPAPTNLPYWWNMGSLMGICLMIQIASGLFLSMQYIPSSQEAFKSIWYIMTDVEKGWLLRYIHANTASMLFLCLLIHIFRGIYFGCFYTQFHSWQLGVLMKIMMFAIAFVGYVLPWGQMSYWGASVITNLLSAIPYIGKYAVIWLWGGFSVDNPTLTRFFIFHFALPFMVLAMMMIHLIMIHEAGSNDPTGINQNIEKINFHHYYTMKDLFGMFTMLSLLMMIVTFTPQIFMESDNFIPANPSVAPLHIKPEWYFLMFYAILRSIPNKLGGVIMMIIAILAPAFIPLGILNNRKSNTFIMISQYIFWLMIMFYILLAWIGACPVEFPYDSMGKTFMWSYFLVTFGSHFILEVMDHMYSNSNHN